MISKKNNLIVLMPPKTASNSITKNLVECGVEFSQDTSTLPKIHLKLKEIVERHGIKNLEEFKIFQIVRNPYDRFISAFYHQKNLIPKKPSIKFSNFDISEFLRHLLDAKNSSNFLENFYGDLSFVEGNVNSGRHWGGSRLFDSQKSWNDLNRPIKIFKLESLSKNIEPLNEYLGFEMKKLSYLNSRGVKSGNLSNEDKKLIFEIFSEDFINFDYKK